MEIYRNENNVFSYISQGKYILDNLFQLKEKLKKNGNSSTIHYLELHNNCIIFCQYRNNKIYFHPFYYEYKIDTDTDIFIKMDFDKNVLYKLKDNIYNKKYISVKSYTVNNIEFKIFNYNLLIRNTNEQYFTKPIKEEDINFISTIMRIIRKKDNECLLDDCNNKAIKSHIISNSLLKKWSNSKQMFFIDSTITSKNIFNNNNLSDEDLFLDQHDNNNKHMKNSKSLTFLGYCSNHDSSLFREIDLFNYKITDNNVKLNFKRINSYEKWRSERDYISCFLVEIFLNNPLYKESIKNLCQSSQNFSDLLEGIKKNNYYDLQVRNVNIMEKLLERVIYKMSNQISNEEIYYKVKKINYILPYIFFGSHLMTMDANNKLIINKNNLECIIFMNFDFENHVTNIIFSCIKKDNLDQKNFDDYFNSFEDKTPKEMFLFFIKNISFGVLNEEFYNNISEDINNKKIFKRLIEDTNFTDFTLVDDEYLSYLLPFLKKEDIFTYLDNFN